MKGRQWRLVGAKYGAITGANFQNQLAYVGDTLSRAVVVWLFMFIFVQLWGWAYETRGTAEMAGLSFGATIWYFLWAEVMEMGKMRPDQRISEEVKDGSIAYTLVRPYNYLAYHFFYGLGDSLMRMGLIFLFGSPLVLYYVGLPPFNLVYLLPWLLIVAQALLLNFFFLSIIGLMAFIIEDTNSLHLIYQKLVFILGGLLIPVDFLPGVLQTIARNLPFSLTTYAPARLFVAFNWTDWVQLGGRQLIWLVVVGLVLWWQYRWAAERLAINGG
ncbi:MAG TPA: ABC-2 family transporter protein [Anaerolineae bacterium]|nr:ABC-2 family transporter protein [Anaerolineae bacterium]